MMNKIRNVLFSLLFLFSLLSQAIWASVLDNKVFVILRHMRTEEDDKLWRRCYESVREYYPNVPIVIIDDNSKFEGVEEELPDTVIIKSEYPGAGELLPYYYFLKYKWADKMVFLHDSMMMRRPFRYFELGHSALFHWHFDNHAWDNNRAINRILGNLNESQHLLEYNKVKLAWNGCFGVASTMDLWVLESLDRVYGFPTLLIDKIHTREDRMALERIFGMLLFREGIVTKDRCSNFGSIFDHPHSFRKIDGDFLEQLKLTYPGAIIKTWHGR